MPLRFGRVGIGAGQQHAEVGQVGPGGPHLLAGDHPVVAVALGPGGQRGQVGAGARLAEQLAPHLLVAHDRRQEPQPLLLGAVGEQRRRGQVEPERVEPAQVVGREHGARRRGPGAGVSVEAAVGHRPRRRDQAGAAEHRVPGLVVGPAAHLPDGRRATRGRGPPRRRHVRRDPAPRPRPRGRRSGCRRRRPAATRRWAPCRASARSSPGEVGRSLLAERAEPLAEVLAPRRQLERERLVAQMALERRRRPRTAAATS